MKKTLFSATSLLFIVIIYSLIATISSQARDQVIDYKCGTVLEHNTTIFVPNFVTMMELLRDQMRNNGFGITQVGTGPDANYGLTQCYGDITLIDCELCYSEIHIRLPGCFPYNSGRIYLDGCFMRAANYSFYDEITSPDDKTLCGNVTKKDSRFQESARKAILDAVTEAPNNGGFARPEVLLSGSTNESAYVLANCWKTVNESACRACLNNASVSAMRCLPSSEGRVLNAGCFLRYSDTNFLNEEQVGTRSKVSKTIIIVIVVSSLVAALIGAIIGNHIRTRRMLQKKRRDSNNTVEIVKTLNDSSLNFKFSTLHKATGYFDDANKLGQGGFGIVYKGVLADGREIAVKRLFVNNRNRAAEFYNEVNLISSVDHKNLVRLLGCSCFGPESLLVYEFLPNMSLDRFLFDESRGKALNWKKRFEIIIGTTEGLVYLHENKDIRIIHRDIKASNILLDSKLRAKLADFGLARTFQEDKSHISTVIAGTLGYMAPEYLAYGQLTEKVDVYSFGVLILEIVTGRQNNGTKNNDFSDSLIIAAWKHFQQGTTEKIFDPNMMLQNYSNCSDIKNDICRVVHVGLLCTQEAPSLRPFMSTALQMLTNKDEQLPAPTNPPFVDEKTMELNDTFEYPWQPVNGSSSPSIANMSYSDFHPR
ncbi:hypothetical protein AQUCO_06100063v1 [Aquilegia coerulea]|uniref:Cysteine-rich receptor-like protein kinase 2 n=2 Tax=Aquilegia coerulea TaxID=218851 RepID=A0A2G5CDF3_AQUCA|nr:hypothetical protein AQUCO_06100063v1 [Aquilegia coerulea]